MSRYALSPLDYDIIKALAANGLSVSKAARELHYHRNTVEYHVHQIYDKTNLSPQDFYDMIKLLRMCEEESA